MNHLIYLSKWFLKLCDLEFLSNSIANLTSKLVCKGREKKKKKRREGNETFKATFGLITFLFGKEGNPEPGGGGGPPIPGGGGGGGPPIPGGGGGGGPPVTPESELSDGSEVSCVFSFTTRGGGGGGPPIPIGGGGGGELTSLFSVTLACNS